MRKFLINTIVRIFEFTKIYTEDFPTVTEYLKKNRHFIKICYFIHNKKTHITKIINTKIDMLEELDIKKFKNKKR